MKERRKRSTITNRTVAYIAAGLVHAVIIGALYFNFSSKPKPISAHYAEKVDVVKATTVDESDIKKQQDLIKEKDLDKKRKLEEEEKKLEDLEKKAEQEEKNIEDLKKKQDQEKKKTAELEAERKKIALKKKQEQEQREKEKKERERKEKVEREKAAEKKKADERKKREAAEAKRKQELADLMSAEEAVLRQERTTTLIGKYSALIQQKVDSYRTISPDFERWREATISIKLSPRGDVLSTQVIKSSGSDRYDNSVESAILKATPLPIPDQNQEPAANKELRNIVYDFKMPGVR